MAYLGALEIYKVQTAAGVVIHGERYICSTELQRAIDSIIQENRMTRAEEDVDRAIGLMASPIGNLICQGS